MSKSTEATSRVHTGFVVHSSNYATVTVEIDEEGYLTLRQDEHLICVPPQAVIRFKRAIAGMGEVS